MNVIESSVASLRLLAILFKLLQNKGPYMIPMVITNVGHRNDYIWQI
jgi:hypothetical protein